MFQWQNETCCISDGEKQGVCDKSCNVFGFRAIGGGRAIASKVFSFLGLYTTVIPGNFRCATSNRWIKLKVEEVSFRFAVEITH